MASKTRTMAQALVDYAKAQAAVGTAEVRGALGTVAEYRLAGSFIDEVYGLFLAEGGQAAPAIDARDWNAVKAAKVGDVSLFEWAGPSTSRTSPRFGNVSETVLQREWKCWHYGTATGAKSGQAWHAACDMAADSDEESIRDDSAYVKTRVDAYVKWVVAVAEGRWNAADGRIASGRTSTPRTPSAKTKDRAARIRHASAAVTAATANAGDGRRGAHLTLGASVTPITASMIRDLSDDALAELREVVAAELARRKAATAKAEAAKLARQAARESTKGKGTKGTKAAKAA